MNSWGSFPVHWWLVVMVAWCGSCSAVVQIKSSSEYCDRYNSTLNCDLKGQDGEMLNDDWDGKLQLIEISNGRLKINNQKGISSTKWIFTNITKLEFDTDPDDNYNRVHVHNSKVELLTHIVDTLNSSNSYIKNIQIQSIRQFDFYKCDISNLHITAIGSKSTILKSFIKNIEYLEINGNFVFEFFETEIEQVTKFIYNMTTNKHIIKNLTVRNVKEGGIIIAGKGATFENVTFDHLDINAIQILSSLVLINCKINSVYGNSILVERGNLTLENVTIEGEAVSLSVIDVEGGVTPLVQVVPPRSDFGTGIALAVVASFVIGIGIGFCISRLCKTKVKGSSIEDKCLIPDAKIELKSEDCTVKLKESQLHSMDDADDYVDIADESNMSSHFSAGSQTASAYMAPNPPLSNASPIGNYPAPTGPKPPGAIPGPIMLPGPKPPGAIPGPTMLGGPPLPLRIPGIPQGLTPKVPRETPAEEEEEDEYEEIDESLSQDAQMEEIYDDLAEEARNNNRPPILTRKPSSFLHSPTTKSPPPAKPSNTVQRTKVGFGGGSGSDTQAPTLTKGNFQWPPKPAVPTPPSSDLKPKHKQSVASEEEIYEEVE